MDVTDKQWTSLTNYGRHWQTMDAALMLEAAIRLLWCSVLPGLWSDSFAELVRSVKTIILLHLVCCSHLHSNAIGNLLSREWNVWYSKEMHIQTLITLWDRIIINQLSWWPAFLERQLTCIMSLTICYTQQILMWETLQLYCLHQWF